MFLAADRHWLLPTNVAYVGQWLSGKLIAIGKGKRPLYLSFITSWRELLLVQVWCWQQLLLLPTVISLQLSLLWYRVFCCRWWVLKNILTMPTPLPTVRDYLAKGGTLARVDRQITKSSKRLTGRLVNLSLPRRATNSLLFSNRLFPASLRLL